MNRTDRLYALVEELRAAVPHALPARRLADKFEVSQRTIERDLLALQESGVPIWATNGRNGGYSIDPQHTLAPLNFTAAEALAVGLALSHTAGLPFERSARSALRKVIHAMPGATAGQAIDLADRIRLLPSEPRPPTMLGESWDLIEDGIARGLVVEIDYADVNRAVTNRRIEPLGLIGNDPHWYVIAWCQLRGATRGFRSDRISAARATGDRAAARPFEIGDEELAALIRPLNLLA